MFLLAQLLLIACDSKASWKSCQPGDKQISEFKVIRKLLAFHLKKHAVKIYTKTVNVEQDVKIPFK